MTGGDIYRIICNDNNKKEEYDNNEIFKNIVDVLMDIADNGEEEFINKIINIIYGLQLAYLSILDTVMQGGDEHTMEIVSNTLCGMLNDESKEDLSKKVTQLYEDNYIDEESMNFIIDKINNKE